jgi:multidrug efflux system membrane fusion protein
MSFWFQAPVSHARAVNWRGGSLPVMVGILLAVAAGGCASKTREAGPAEVPVVPVSHPIQRLVTDYVDFTGRTDAVQSVNIIARVTGYLVQMPFKEGSEVKAGDLLFEIDPRPYQAQLDQAKSQVTLNEAQLDLAKTTLARYQVLDKTTPGAVSKQALDQYKAAVVEAQARVDAQKKTLEVYNLNKEFTRVVSPIDGQVSRYYLTLGNLVNQDQTLLTTIVSLDPMYAYFDMDERTLLQIRKAISEGKIASPGCGDIQVELGLQNEDGFPHKGTINFVNNQVNSTTGSITMRGVFANPKLISAATAAESKASSAEKGCPPVANSQRFVPRLFSPGMFVRVRLPIGEPHKSLLIIDRAIQSDQGLKYVYVVDAQNKVQTRSVKTGPLQEDGLRVVEGEIKLDDWVVVGAIQQVRPQTIVKPEQRPMPSLAGQSDAAPPAVDRTKAGKSATGKPKI